METEREKQLMNQNQKLKKRIQEMEELFGETDEQYHTNLKELMDEKKELTAKINALESRLFAAKEENAELADMVENSKSLAGKNAPPQPTGSHMSESLVAEYNDLQEQVEKLNGDKVSLQSRIREMVQDMADMVEKIESLESINAELNEALTILSKEKKRLSQENKRMAECVTSMQMQIDALSVAKSVDRKEHEHSLFGEIEAAREQLVQKTAEMEQEMTVLRRTLASRGDEDRRRAKDLECMRDSAKTLSEKNKELRKELELRKDAEAESTAVKQAASQIEKENVLLKAEVARLKKQFVNAESRADENAHLLSKAAVSKSELIRDIQRQNDPINVVHSTPLFSGRQRTPSLSRNESIKAKRPSALLRSASTTRTATSPSKENPRKRGVMLDISEPSNRLDFKIPKLSDNQQRQTNHLKSHYDPEVGAYDQSHGESPKSAAKLNTPKKENRILGGILRRK
jgi:predicted nuclease with TOPRIM domain